VTTFFKKFHVVTRLVVKAKMLLVNQLLSFMLRPHANSCRRIKMNLHRAAMIHPFTCTCFHLFFILTRLCHCVWVIWWGDDVRLSFYSISFEYTIVCVIVKGCYYHKLTNIISTINTIFAYYTTFWGSGCLTPKWSITTMVCCCLV